MNNPETLSYASDKAKCFAKKILKTHVSLYWFSLLEVIRTCIIFPKMTEKVITNFDLSKASGPDCILGMVLKNCEPELSKIIVKPFNICLKESCFPDFWKVSSVLTVLKNVVERSPTKNYLSDSLPSVVGTVFEKLANNRFIDHLEKHGLYFLISSMVLGLLNQPQIL